MSKSSTFWQSMVCWLCVAVGVFWALVGIPVLGWIPPVLPLVSIPIALILGIGRYGARGTLVYWLAAMVISSIFENLSVLTGFPFGHYHYTIGPKLFLVPLFIAPVYASFGFICWSIALTLLDDADRRLRGAANIILLPIIAGAVMTMWDLVTDAEASTVRQTWVWEQGGRYFGVPETNFLGWWLVTYLFFQCFALYLRFANKQIAKPRGYFDTFPPIILYGVMGINVLVDFAVNRDRAVKDATGTIWHVTGIVGPMAVVTLFTMIFVTILASHRAAGPSQLRNRGTS